MDKDPLTVSCTLIDTPLKLEILMTMKKINAHISIIELIRAGNYDKIGLTKCIWQLYNDHLIRKEFVDGDVKFVLTESSEMFCLIVDKFADWSQQKKISDSKRACKK